MKTSLKPMTHPLIAEVQDRMRDQLSGYPASLVASLEQRILPNGKPIRPTITLLIGSIFEADREDILNLAAAIEMMHTATSVHDTLLKQAGQPQSPKTLNTRFVTSATVLAGDLAFSAAAQLAAATNRIAVMEKFSETLQVIVSGKITHMVSNGNSLNRQAYFDRIRARTASLFELAASLAATIGSASPAEINAAAQFGLDFGMAFQITRDILSLKAAPSLWEKSANSDLRQQVITLPTVLYLEKHPTDQKFNAILNSNGNGQVADLLVAIQQSGVFDLAADVARRFLQQGLDALTRLPERPERHELTQLATWVTDRIH